MGKLKLRIDQTQLEIAKTKLQITETKLEIDKTKLEMTDFNRLSGPEGPVFSLPRPRPPALTPYWKRIYAGLRLG